MKLEKFIKKYVWNIIERTYLFEKEIDFRKNLCRIEKGFGRDIEKTMKHERAHYDMTIKLGHNPPMYGVGICRRKLFGFKFKPWIEALVRFDGDIPLKDKLKIYLAPEEPGPADYILAKECQKLLK